MTEPQPTLDELRAGATKLERALPPQRRKRLGQFFTTAPLARLLAAVAVRGAPRSLLDPMAGHGELLDWTWARLAALGRPPEIVDAIEVDAAVAMCCDPRLRAAAASFGGAVPQVVAGDAFAPATIATLARTSYDLVITNPPYVRYQALRTSGVDGEASMSHVRSNLRLLASELAPISERSLWAGLVDGYSGLADLSVPSWLLAALLTRPGGTLALVVPAAWQSRDYAGVLRYLMVRCFDHVQVVSAAGRIWFDEALVDTTLVIGRRTLATSVFAPADSVHRPPGRWTRVTLPEAGSARGSLVGALYPDDPDPDGAFAAGVAGTAPDFSDVGRPLALHLRETERADEAMAVLTQTTRARWRLQADGREQRATGRSAAHGTRGAAAAETAGAALPRVVHELLAARGLSARITTPGAVGIQVGQGLRTGCNPFFYVEALGDAPGGRTRVRTSALFGHRELAVHDALMRAVVRRQQEVKGAKLDASALRGRVLLLAGWYLPEDIPDGAGDHAGVLDEALASWVREAAKTEHRTGETATPIPLLTAVRPNADRRSGRWYMLPALAPRHTPAAFVARVCADAPRVICNADPRVVVDANFSTLWSDPIRDQPAWSGPAIAAVFNSAWGAACIEALGTPMGGGALKLEATHLRRFPWPEMSEPERRAFQEASAALQRAPADTALRATIDRAVLHGLFGPVVEGDAAALQHALVTEGATLRARRNRR